MTNKPLVTIAIPNYNYGHYLRNCLDSVLAQTYDNFEVYFRDNNSTDNSYEIALSYKEKFKERGVYFNVTDNKRNLGSDRNSQLATRDAEGEFLYTLASDDSIEPTFIEKCISVFDEYPNVSMVMTHRNEIDENGNIIKTQPFYNQSCIIKGEDQAAVFMMAGIAIPGQRITRLSSFSQTSQYRRIWNVAGDWYENFLFSMAGDIAYIKEPLCNYRVHSGNETNESEKNLLGITEHYQLINAFVDVSKAFGMTKPAARYNEAVEKLGSMCLRYAFKMLQNKLNDAAHRYLLLAPVYKRDIVEDITYKKLMKCIPISGKELDDMLNEIQGENPLSRTKSYDPPEGFIPLNI